MINGASYIDELAANHGHGSALVPVLFQILRSPIGIIEEQKVSNARDIVPTFGQGPNGIRILHKNRILVIVHVTVWPAVVILNPKACCPSLPNLTSSGA